MKPARVVMLSLWMVLLCSLLTPAQQSVTTAVNATVPPLIEFSNVATDAGGNTLSGVVSITFSLYAGQQGGEPLWTETQNNVQLDPTGHYSVQLGITKNAGVPTTLFTTGEARWLGVRIAEQGEQPRVLLLSVPYALKAGDAATIGGLPPSAFVLAAPGGSAPPYARDAVAGQAPSPPTALDVTTSGGTVNYLPLWDSASDITSSVLFQTGSGTTAKIGIGITTPAATLDVKGSTYLRGRLTLPAGAAATATKGSNSQPLTMVASAYNTSGTPASMNQNFEWLAEPANNDTATPSGTLNLLFGQGSGAFAETGLSIASNGQITFAPEQTFPGGGSGGGTITGVTAGTDLTGGGTSGNVTLNLNTANIPLLAAANTFTGNQTVNGIFSASSSAFGVVGTANATSGIGVGVGGTASSPSGYGVEGVNKASSGGAGVFGTSAASAGYGVEGQNTASSGGTGVYGTAPQFGVYGTATGTGSTVGVFGSGVDGLQGSGTAHGVYGASSTAGAMGVYGTAPSFGVYGLASNTSGTAVGVFGAGVDGLQGSGTAYGVYAAGTGSSSTGVFGTSPSLGLSGTATNTSGTSIGVLGSGGSHGVYGTAPNFGLYGVATATSGNSVGVFGVGIDGLQGSGSKYGVYSATTTGTAGSYGVYGAPSLLGSEGPWYICILDCGDEFSSGVNISNQAGVWADSNSTGGSAGLFVPALLATADADVAAVVLNNTTNWPGALFYNWGGQDYTGGGGGTMGDVVGDAVRAGGPGGTCSLTGGGDAACTGTLKSVVATKGSAGAQRVETYSVQSAENWFEDAGTAQLVNGTAHVNLESVFGQTVNTGVEYHVFLTPDGDCKGLYVSSKTASGFEVRELGGGAASIAFEYRIMAKRVGYENVRLKNVTERFNKQEAQSKKMQQRPAPSSAAPQANPETLTSPFRAEVQPPAVQPR
jgi:hypothetical protein